MTVRSGPKSKSTSVILFLNTTAFVHTSLPRGSWIDPEYRSAFVKVLTVGFSTFDIVPPRRFSLEMAYPPDASVGLLNLIVPPYELSVASSSPS